MRLHLPELPPDAIGAEVNGRYYSREDYEQEFVMPFRERAVGPEATEADLAYVDVSALALAQTFENQRPSARTMADVLRYQLAYQRAAGRAGAPW